MASVDPVVPPAVNLGAFGAVVLAEPAQEGLVVGGEVLVHIEGGVERDEGDEIGGLHLLVDEVLGAFDGAVDVLGLHGGEIEEEDHKAVVAEVFGVGGEVFVEQVGDGGLAGDGVLFGEDGGLVDVLVVEAGDLLGFVVFEDGVKSEGLRSLTTAPVFLSRTMTFGEDDVGVDF